MAVDGMLKRHLSTETMETLLRRELLPAESEVAGKKTLRDVFKVKRNDK
jgi:hypothetical protein